MDLREIGTAVEFLGQRTALAAASPEGTVAVVSIVFLLACIAVLLAMWAMRRMVYVRRAPAVIPPEPVDPLELELQTLRLKHGVRPLNALEETLTLQSLPEDVYGFTLLPGQMDSPVLKTKTPELFEVHKIAGDRILVVGFVTTEAASVVNTVVERFNLVLYSSPHESAPTAVSISMSHVMRYEQRRVEDENILEMRIDPAGAEPIWELTAASRKPPATGGGVPPQVQRRAAG